MSKQNLFNTLEIPGSFLIPGFSIYVLEIVKEKQKWFYIGMTGDPYYPSARAAFHRISGHLELSERSTQNQLQNAIKAILKIKDERELASLKIKMHHFPIPGFGRITDQPLSVETMQQLVLTRRYKKYKDQQQKVLALENALIYELKNKLLNKTKGKKIKVGTIPFPNIYKGIIELVNNG